MCACVCVVRACVSYLFQLLVINYLFPHRFELSMHCNIFSLCVIFIFDVEINNHCVVFSNATIFQSKDLIPQLDHMIKQTGLLQPITRLDHQATLFTVYYWPSKLHDVTQMSLSFHLGFLHSLVCDSIAKTNEEMCWNIYAQPSK